MHQMMLGPERSTLKFGYRSRSWTDPNRWSCTSVNLSKRYQRNAVGWHCFYWLRIVRSQNWNFGSRMLIIRGIRFVLISTDRCAKSVIIYIFTNNDNITIKSNSYKSQRCGSLMAHTFADSVLAQTALQPGAAARAIESSTTAPLLRTLLPLYKFVSRRGTDHWVLGPSASEFILELGYHRSHRSPGKRSGCSGASRSPSWEETQPQFTG